VCVCIHVFMCDREYVREYKTESVPSVCEREGFSVCACKCVCLRERERQKEKESERQKGGERDRSGGRERGDTWRRRWILRVT